MNNIKKFSKQQFQQGDAKSIDENNNNELSLSQRSKITYFVVDDKLNLPSFN